MDEAQDMAALFWTALQFCFHDEDEAIFYIFFDPDQSIWHLKERLLCLAGRNQPFGSQKVQGRGGGR